MGGMGHLYEVDDSARHVVQYCKLKSDWYSVVGDFITKQSLELNTEESLQGWAAFVPNEPYPVSHLIKGEFHSEDNDFWDDPHISFLGRELVKNLALVLRQKGKAYYESRLTNIHQNMQIDIWLYDPLCNFLESVANRNNAVIVLGSRYSL